MNNVVVGVDCSTKRLAFVALHGTEVVGCEKFDAKGSLPWQRRLRELADHARAYFGSRKALLVFVEEPPMGRSYRASLEVGYVVGAVIIEALRAGHLVTPVNPSTWKKQTVGNGRADKDMIREWATRYIFESAGVEPPKEQDLHDAACIAAFARQNLRGTE